MRKNEREKEQESDDEDNNATTKNETELDEIKHDVKFQEGGLEKKKQNK